MVSRRLRVIEPLPEKSREEVAHLPAPEYLPGPRTLADEFPETLREHPRIYEARRRALLDRIAEAEEP